MKIIERIGHEYSKSLISKMKTKDLLYSNVIHSSSRYLYKKILFLKLTPKILLLDKLEPFKYPQIKIH
jgi:hypothetical protein